MQTKQSVRILACALLAAAGVLPLRAAGAKLGDPAAPLTISDWIKGNPVDLSKGRGKSIHVIEFWATWCGPCKVSIPHLTELAKKFKDQDVVFIGVSDEDAATVKPFVARMGDKMSYTVACDPSGKTQEAYMTAYNQNGIPTAFVVDKDGRVVWVGHPMANLEKTLDKLVAGTFDLAAAKKEADEENARNEKRAAVVQTFTEYMRLAMAGDEPEKAARLGEQMLKDVADDAAVLNQIAWIVLTSDQIKKRDLAFALKAAKAAAVASDSKEPAILDTYARALFENGKKQEAIAEEKKALALAQDGKLREKLEKTLKEFESKTGTAK
jgi:thiol-disulfide isomerase/thioredoxin